MTLFEVQVELLNDDSSDKNFKDDSWDCHQQAKVNSTIQLKVPETQIKRQKPSDKVEQSAETNIETGSLSSINLSSKVFSAAAETFDIKFLLSLHDLLYFTTSQPFYLGPMEGRKIIKNTEKE